MQELATTSLSLLGDLGLGNLRFDQDHRTVESNTRHYQFIFCIYLAPLQG